MSLVAVDFDNKVVDIVDNFAVLLEVAGIFVDCRRTLSLLSHLVQVMWYSPT